MGKVQLTWLGHSAFQVVSPEGKVILIDPWFDNPKFPKGFTIPRADLILVTHGHFDHLGNTIELAQKYNAQVIAIYELIEFLKQNDVKNFLGMNKGGTTSLMGFELSMVRAEHSSGVSKEDEVIYAGEPVGFILKFSDGVCLYHAGDTDVFSDMELIKAIHKPTVALLPIGGFYTMDPVGAGHAIRLLGPKKMVPMHYGTFDALPGTPDAVRAHLPKTTELIVLLPGETVTL